MKAAGIVLYNPDLQRLQENISSIQSQVETLILVDNGSANIDEIKRVFGDSENTVLVENEQNCGIAKALNQIVDKACEHGCEWVLTLDQDTVCREHLMEKYNEILPSADHAGMLTCRFQDRNILEEIQETDELCDVDFCITSAALTNVAAVREVGGFDEQMFIDLVDYDICYALRRKGYRIVQAGFIGFLHEVGHSEEHRFLGKKLTSYNHSPLRKYYWARNNVYFARKYNLGTLFWMKRIVMRLFVTVLYEKQKIKKVHMQLKGIRDGLKMQIVNKENLNAV